MINYRNNGIEDFEEKKMERQDVETFRFLRRYIFVILQMHNYDGKSLTESDSDFLLSASKNNLECQWPINDNIVTIFH